MKLTLCHFDQNSPTELNKYATPLFHSQLSLTRAFKNVKKSLAEKSCETWFSFLYKFYYDNPITTTTIYEKGDKITLKKYPPIKPLKNEEKRWTRSRKIAWFSSFSMWKSPPFLFRYDSIIPFEPFFHAHEGWEEVQSIVFPNPLSKGRAWNSFSFP